jgi:tetratricopeptide (TPR) repeat protein
LAVNKRFFKHNPALLEPHEVVSHFAVRHRELAWLLQRLRENTTGSNQHVLVVGQRGSGKSMLVRRLACELTLEKDKELSEKWYPIVFPEESYLVSTVGEFWLETVKRLAQQPGRPGEGRWLEVFHELRREKDEQRLCERALAKLRQFASEQGKRLVIVVENLNMVFDEQMSKDAAWALRKTLINEPWVMLLGTATMRFEAIESAEAAFFELFDIFQLHPLGGGECRDLWQSLTGERLEDKRVRPLEILTGGNARLIGVLALFAASRSLRECLQEFDRLMDDHTDYFKSNIDTLPAGERKVFVSTAALWQAAGAREIAEHCRMGVNETSAVLASLVRKGAISVVAATPRAKMYDVAERMYGIYLTIRQEGDLRGRVLALIRLMSGFYDPPALCGVAQCFAQEALQLDPHERAGLTEEAMREAEAGAQAAYCPPSALNLLAWSWYESGSRDLLRKAEEWAREAVEKAPDNSYYLHTLSCVLGAMGRWEEALPLVPRFLADTKMVERCIGDVVHFLVRFAAAGYVREAAAMLQASPSAGLVEPLIVALRLFFEEKVIAPREVMEVAKDIRDEIEKVAQDGRANVLPPPPGLRPPSPTKGEGKRFQR